MNEETTKVQDTQLEEKKVENVATPEIKVDEEKISNSIIDKLAGMFKNDTTKNEEDDTNGSEDTSNGSNTKDKEPNIDIEAMVNEKVQATITKMAYETKEKAKKEIEAEQELKEKVSKVNEDFKELVEFKISNDKDFNVEEFLKDNPHAKAKETNTTNNIISNSNNDNYSEEEKRLLAQLNNN